MGTPARPRRDRASFSSSRRNFADVARGPLSFASGRGARQAAKARIASAQVQALRKAGMPASPRARAASGASGTRNVANGLPLASQSMMGCRANSGLKRAEEPTRNREHVELGCPPHGLEGGAHGVILRAGQGHIDHRSRRWHEGPFRQWPSACVPKRVRCRDPRPTAHRPTSRHHRPWS